MTTTSTPINTIVAGNVRHYLRNRKPSAVAEWLGITTVEAVALLEGEASFTVAQLSTLTKPLKAGFLELALSPGQQWAHTLRAGLTDFDTTGNLRELESVLWDVLGQISQHRVSVIDGASVHRADMLLFTALQTINTAPDKDLVEDARERVTSSMREAIMVLDAV